MAVDVMRSGWIPILFWQWSQQDLFPFSQGRGPGRRFKKDCQGLGGSIWKEGGANSKVGVERGEDWGSDLEHGMEMSVRFHVEILRS